MQAAIFTRGILSRRLFAIPLAIAPICAMSAASHGQIFVANFGPDTVGEYSTTGDTINPALLSFPGGYGYLITPYAVAVSGSGLFVATADSRTYTSTIGEYTTSGSTVNASLVSGIPGVIEQIAVSGSDLFAVSYNNSVSPASWVVGEYTTSGATLNAALISAPGFTYDMGIALSGSDLFVNTTNQNTGVSTIAQYTTSGTVINPSLISGLHEIAPGFAVAGSDVFVFDNGGNYGVMSEYATSGALVNASLATGTYPSEPESVALSGSDLFILNSSTIGEYTTDGTVVDADLISGLDEPGGIAVVVSEPAELELLAATSALMILRRRYRA